MHKFWTVLGTAAALASPLISAQAASQKGIVAPRMVSPSGTTTLAAAAPRAASPLMGAPPADDGKYTFGPGGPSPETDPAIADLFGAPQAAPVKLASAAGNIFGFDGLSHYDQRFAGTGVYYNTQFSEEPPDQAMAVGNGYIVEAVNNALAVYKTDGTLASAPTPMYQFLGLPPEYIRGTGAYGAVSLSDPRAYYDPTTKRFFVEEWGTGQDPTGAATGTSAIYVAVSLTSDPTGPYTLYTFDTSFDPNAPMYTDKTGAMGQVPILPDYVQIGVDANGFYMSINEFDYFGLLVPGRESFVGVRILAVSKKDMVAGVSTPIVSFSGGDLYNAGFTVQPAKTPLGTSYETGGGGTEYFLSSIFSNTASNQLALWGISNTSSLTAKTPSLTLSDTALSCLPYTQPTSAIQKAGPIPLGDSVGSPENRLSSGDTRMTTVTYSQGHLYSAVETSFANRPVNINSGFTYFSVAPSVDAMGNVSGLVNRQAFVSVPGETVSYPTVGVNGKGGAVITCSLIGPDYFPSAAYVPLDSHLKALGLVISSLGAAPSDGFTGYKAYGGGGVARWGDYSEAQSDENGVMWMAQEMVSASSSTRRSSLANYGTHITAIMPTSTFGYK